FVSQGELVRDTARDISTALGLKAHTLPRQRLSFLPFYSYLYLLENFSNFQILSKKPAPQSGMRQTLWM
ncbi:hypothetical protein ACUODF_59735, partial [Escherichia coli]